jgi:hypothetical protein
MGRLDALGCISRTAGIGATSPLPCVPAKVPSPPDLQTFAIVPSCGESRWFAEVTIYALASHLSARGREGAGRLSAAEHLAHMDRHQSAASF